MAKSGKTFIEKTIFLARKMTIEKHLDPSRDSVLLSWATYSPWLLDQAFLDCHNIIKKFTLVDIFRCYELWHLLEQVSSLPGEILEVGTWRGGTGCLLGKKATILGLGSKVILCDTFTGVVKTGQMDSSYQGGEHADTSVAIVEECASMLEISNLKLLSGIFPEETGGEIEDLQFRFCHIDVDVYQSGKDVLEWVWKRMPIGGIIVFDDFGFSSTRGITQLVHEEEKKTDRVSIQNLNGHAVFIRTK